MSKKVEKEKKNEIHSEEQDPKLEETHVNEGQSQDQSEDAKAQEEKSDFEALVNDLNSKLADLNDKYLRLSAEFDNYRKRTLKEKMELTKSAGEGVLKGILPVVDDFDRALAHLDDAKDLEAMKTGIVLIYNKFKEFMNQQGLKEIETREKEFDTDLHEAITKIPAPSEGMKGKVVDCIEKGYVLNDKVIRYAKVVVGE